MSNAPDVFDRCDGCRCFAVRGVVQHCLAFAGFIVNAAALALVAGQSWTGLSKTIVVTVTSPSQTGAIVNSVVASAWQNVLTQTLFSTQVVAGAANSATDPVWFSDPGRAWG